MNWPATEIQLKYSFVASFPKIIFIICIKTLKEATRKKNAVIYFHPFSSWSILFNIVMMISMVMIVMMVIKVFMDIMIS